ncbi:MAG: peptidoglycan DD-metalloendopeptidase family protein [Hyphomicrobium sp.]
MSAGKTVFVSHASEQKAEAEAIALSLRAHDLTVFLDADDLLPGQSYDARLHQAVFQSDAFVFLISPEALTTHRYTLTELKFAREKWPNPSGHVLPAMVVETPLRSIPGYLKAVRILEPDGNLAAETSAAVVTLLATTTQRDPHVRRRYAPTWSLLTVLITASAAVAAWTSGIVSEMTTGPISRYIFNTTRTETPNSKEGADPKQQDPIRRDIYIPPLGSSLEVHTDATPIGSSKWKRQVAGGTDPESDPASKAVFYYAGHGLSAPANEPSKIVPPAFSALVPDMEKAIAKAMVTSWIWDFRWPTRGPLLASFGKTAEGSLNDGIAILATAGTGVHAAEAGQVVYAGTGLKSYGKLVVLRHDRFWTTVYAHNSEILVQKGDVVQRGQRIARSGPSRWSRHKYVHFELRLQEKPVNPVPHLAAE